MTSSPVELPHVHAMWAADTASAHLGIACVQVGLTDAGLGWARTRMTVTDTMVNGHGICHGGYLFTLADSTFALACNARGEVTVAAGADITFIGPVRAGEVLLASAVERTAYGRSGITDVTVTREGDGATVAEFRGRSRSLPRRS